MPPDRSDQAVNDWFRRGGRDLPANVDEPAAATPIAGADGGAHSPPLKPPPGVDHAIRSAYARSGKRL
jgi:hypothetical protein